MYHADCAELIMVVKKL